MKDWLMLAASILSGLWLLVVFSIAFSGERRLARIRFVAAWYDAWIGAYWDADELRLYVLPVPCLGIVLEFWEP